MKFVTGILACRHRMDRVQSIRDSFFCHLPNPFFFVGGEGESRREGDTIFLPCKDNYEGIPAKMWHLYDYLIKNVEFDYFIKSDDDCYVYAPRLESVFDYVSRHPPDETHYFGRKVVRGGARDWHFGKVEDSRYDRLYEGEFKYPYCAGGYGVVLSRKAVELLAEHGREHFCNDQEMYEDKVHGDVLIRFGIWPRKVNIDFVLTDLRQDTIRYLHAINSKGVLGPVRLVLSASSIVTLDAWHLITLNPRWLLPLDPVSVDAISVLMTFPELEPYACHRLLAECFRVLKPGGVLRLVVQKCETFRLISPNRLPELQVQLGSSISVDSLNERQWQNAQSLWAPDLLLAVLKGLGFSRKDLINVNRTPQEFGLKAFPADSSDLWLFESRK